MNCPEKTANSLRRVNPWRAITASQKSKKRRGLVMIDSMVAWASSPSTAVWVLAISVVILVAETTRHSGDALWGDLFADECDDE